MVFNAFLPKVFALVSVVKVELHSVLVVALGGREKHDTVKTDSKLSFHRPAVQGRFLVYNIVNMTYSVPQIFVVLLHFCGTICIFKIEL
jgi:hypothetical protein